MLGLLHLEDAREAGHPDKTTLGFIEVFAGLAGKLIENHSLFTQARGETMGLEKSAEIAHSLEFLPESEAALVATLERIRFGLETAGMVGRQSDELSALVKLAGMLCTHFSMQVGLAAQSGPAGGRIVAVAGSLPEGANPEALFGQRNPLRQSLQDNKLIFVPDLAQEPEWSSSSLVRALGSASFIVLPFEGLEGQCAAVMVSSGQPFEPLSYLDYRVYEQLCVQIGNGLRNLGLAAESKRRLEEVNLLLEFSRKISSLDREHILQTLVETSNQVLYKSQACWFGILDEEAGWVAPLVASGYADNEALLEIHIPQTGDPAPLPVRAIQEARPFLTNETLFSRDYGLAQEDLLVYQHGAAKKWPVSVLAVPALLGNKALGVLVAESFGEGEPYGPEDQTLALSLAGQAALALENARLYEESVRKAVELDQRSSRMWLLNRLSADLGSTLDGSTVLNLTCERLARALNTVLVAVVLRDSPDKIYLTAESPAGYGKSYPQSLPRTPFLEPLGPSTEPVSISDVQEVDGLWPLAEAYFDENGTRSLLIVPLATGSDLLGWVLAQDSHVRHFTAAEIELAITVCNQTAMALQNARRFEETRLLKEDLERRVEERSGELVQEHHNTQTMLRVITELAASMDIQQVLNRSLIVLNEALAADEALIVVANSRRVFHAGQDLLGAGGPEGSFTRVEMDLQRWVIRQRQPAILADIGSDEYWNPEQETRPYCSLIALPLAVGEETLGVLMLSHRRPNFFDEGQLALLEGVSRQMAITLNNAEAFKLIRDQSENLGGLLRAQEIESSRSRGILEAVADGVIVTDPLQEITLFNRSAEQILAVKSRQVLHKSILELINVMGGTGSGWIPTIQRWSTGLTKDLSGETFAEQVNLNHGRVVSIHLSPVIWRNEYLGTVSIFRDITHQTQVDRLKSEFVANVSHELRTPLTSIKGYVDILLMGAAGEANAQQTHFLTIVKENTERLNNLVNDLLDVSRIQSGRVRLNLQSLDMRLLAGESVNEMRRRAQEKGKAIEFNVEAGGDLPWARGDYDRVVQVLHNLLTNSLNYTEDGGSVTVRVSLREPASVQVDVQDTGIGIPLKDQSRIFDRFFRGDNPLVFQTAGTGLGLALSKLLVEMQNGQIWFKSSGIPGEGSVFSFTLPAYNNEVSAQPNG